MKNSQKGFVVPLLLAIIAVLVIGGGVYIYSNKKAEAPAIIDTGTQQTNNNQQQTNTQTPPVATQSSLTVLSPNGGEVYKKGDTAYIRWNTLNIGKATLEIDLIRRDGTLVYNLGSLVNPLKGSQIDQNGVAYSWAIPTDGSPGGRKIDSGEYKIRISISDQSSITDTSDSYFTITNNTVTYKTYNDNVFGLSFEYPTNWSVKESIYATPGQQYNGEKGDVVALVVVSPDGKEIVIGGRQAECRPSTSTIKAACFKNMPITITAIDAQSILVFNHLVASLSSKY